MEFEFVSLINCSSMYFNMLMLMSIGWSTVVGAGLALYVSELLMVEQVSKWEILCTNYTDFDDAVDAFIEDHAQEEVAAPSVEVFINMNTVTPIVVDHLIMENLERDDAPIPQAYTNMVYYAHMQ